MLWAAGMDDPSSISVAPDGGALLHEAERGLLHKVLGEHLQTVLDRADEAGRPVPGFVERELRDAVQCGDLSLGFVRAHCTDCGLDRLVGLSCKRRSLCEPGTA